MSDEHAVSTAEFRRIAPVWAWLRSQFSVTSVLTIAGVITGMGGWAVSLQTRVVVLEHEITHVVTIAVDKASLAQLTQEVSDHDARISRLEKDWDDAREMAGSAPRPRRGR